MRCDVYEKEKEKRKKKWKKKEKKRQESKMTPSFLAEQHTELLLTQLGKTWKANIKKAYQELNLGHVKFAIAIQKEISSRQFDMRDWNYGERSGLEM